MKILLVFEIILSGFNLLIIQMICNAMALDLKKSCSPPVRAFHSLSLKLVPHIPILESC